MADERHHRTTARVLDPERDTAALKALTHPLRVRLLGLLREDGPATATELAARTGESSASTSYHLRVLARYDFVGEAEHRDGRERRWRAVHSLTSWDNAAVHASSGGREFVGAIRGIQLRHLEHSLRRHEEDVTAGRLGPQWLEPSGVSDLLVRLTPESLAELQEAFHRKADELAVRDERDPRAQKVVLLWAGLPLAPNDTRGADPDSGASDISGTSDTDASGAGADERSGNGGDRGDRGDCGGDRDGGRPDGAR